MKTTIIVVLVAVLVLVAGYLVLQRRRGPAAGAGENHTLNPDAESAATAAEAAPTPERLVGETPFDTLTADGSGTAIAGAGAGGYTPDARRPLTSGGGDAENSPDT